jgi:hypothetical protein
MFGKLADIATSLKSFEDLICDIDNSYFSNGSLINWHSALTLTFIYCNYTPNVVVEWFTLLRIQEVLGSDVGPETGFIV